MSFLSVGTVPRFGGKDDGAAAAAVGGSDDEAPPEPSAGRKRKTDALPARGEVIAMNGKEPYEWKSFPTIAEIAAFETEKPPKGTDAREWNNRKASYIHALLFYLWVDESETGTGYVFKENTLNLEPYDAPDNQFFRFATEAWDEIARKPEAYRSFVENPGEFDTDLIRPKKAKGMGRDEEKEANKKNDTRAKKLAESIKSKHDDVTSQDMEGFRQLAKTEVGWHYGEPWQNNQLYTLFKRRVMFDLCDGDDKTDSLELWIEEQEAKPDARFASVLALFNALELLGTPEAVTSRKNIADETAQRQKATRALLRGEGSKRGQGAIALMSEELSDDENIFPVGDPEEEERAQRERALRRETAERNSAARIEKLVVRACEAYRAEALEAAIHALFCFDGEWKSLTADDLKKHFTHELRRQPLQHVLRALAGEPPDSEASEFEGSLFRLLASKKTIVSQTGTALSIPEWKQEQLDEVALAEPAGVDADLVAFHAAIVGRASPGRAVDAAAAVPALVAKFGVAWPMVFGRRGIWGFVERMDAHISASAVAKFCLKRIGGDGHSAADMLARERPPREGRRGSLRGVAHQGDGAEADVVRAARREQVAPALRTRGEDGRGGGGGGGASGRVERRGRGGGGDPQRVGHEARLLGARYKDGLRQL